MSEMSFEGFDSGADWDVVERLINRSAADPVTDFDVIRLRSAVRRSLAPPRRLHSFALRFAAAVAVLVVGAVALFTVIDGRDLREQSPAGVSVSRDATGSVVFHFDDGAAVHRITKAASPAPGAPAEVKVARGRTFVDHNGQPQPGQVIFYRID